MTSALLCPIGFHTYGLEKLYQNTFHNATTKRKTPPKGDNDGVLDLSIRLIFGSPAGERIISSMGVFGKLLVNYLALKDEASNFNGNSEHRGLASFATANIALVSSTGDSRRYHAMCFKTDVLGGVDVSIMLGTTIRTDPGADREIFQILVLIPTVRAGLG